MTRLARTSDGASLHRVVIVGCGFGGLFAARALRRAPVQVTAIDRTNHHLFQPLLYQLATGILSSGEIAPPIRDVLRKQRNAKVLLGDVVGIDADRRSLAVQTLGSEWEVGYDSLIIATGAAQSYFGHDEFAAAAPGLKSLDDALEIRARIFGAFELAEREPDPEERARLMTFVVIGGGPTGVEMAGQIAELSHRALRGNFRSIDLRQARVLLLDGGRQLLASFPESLQRRTIRDLERLGVEIHLGVRVTGVDANGVETDSTDAALERIPAAVKIWAAGVQASPLGHALADATGAGVDRAGRVQVRDDCSVPGHPEIFVVGDLMALDDLPGVAEVAMQSGIHAGRTIVRRLRDKPDEPFKYRDLGSMATISRFRAVVTLGPLRLSGFIGWLGWLLVHLAFLTGFKNRVATIASWTVAFIGHGRPERAITAHQGLRSSDTVGRGTVAGLLAPHAQTEQGEDERRKQRRANQVCGDRRAHAPAGRRECRDSEYQRELGGAQQRQGAAAAGVEPAVVEDHCGGAAHQEHQRAEHDGAQDAGGGGEGADIEGHPADGEEEGNEQPERDRG
ncbi:MAG TPA: NAD(P)/FAD-dependent oxidoreductase [Solirubrobacteraceae bacterium]|nr:NAD(P)/FAD-dependent oxidoreductase [Solirubrobacteraceae bacterium]